MDSSPSINAPDISKLACQTKKPGINIVVIATLVIQKPKEKKGQRPMFFTSEVQPGVSWWENTSLLVEGPILPLLTLCPLATLP